MIQGISIYEILTLTSVIFFIGVYGFLTRKNLITMLLSIELILNASAINFVVINTYLYPGNLQGVFFAVFVVAVAAAETALAEVSPIPTLCMARPAPTARCQRISDRMRSYRISAGRLTPSQQSIVHNGLPCYS